MLKDIRLSSVRLDGGTQMRESLDKSMITTFVADMKAGDKFPPVDIFHDGKNYWLADGFHRFYGSREAGFKTLSAKVHEGGKRDAVLFAVGANATHGLRRTNADKRRSVETLLNDDEWIQWSDRMIAEKCGVSQPFVSKLRDELITVISCGESQQKTTPKPPAKRTKGKDGKVRTRPAPKKKKPYSRTPLPSPDEVVVGTDDATPERVTQRTTFITNDISAAVKTWLKFYSREEIMEAITA